MVYIHVMIQTVYKTLLADFQLKLFLTVVNKVEEVKHCLMYFLIWCTCDSWCIFWYDVHATPDVFSDMLYMRLLMYFLKWCTCDSLMLFSDIYTVHATPWCYFLIYMMYMRLPDVIFWYIYILYMRLPDVIFWYIYYTCDSLMLFSDIYTVHATPDVIFWYIYTQGSN